MMLRWFKWCFFLFKSFEDRQFDLERLVKISMYFENTRFYFLIVIV